MSGNASGPPGEVAFSDVHIALLKDEFTEWARSEGVLDALDQSALAGDDPPLVLRAFLAGAIAGSRPSGKPMGSGSGKSRRA